MDNFNMQPQDNGPSLAMPQGAPPGPDGMPGADAGVTDKEQFEQIIQQIPIEQLMQLVQSMPPEQLADKIQQICVQQLGMDPDEATSFSITLMKVIYERIQEETGQAITDITGVTGGPQESQPEPSLVPPDMGGPNG